ncbi:MAG: ExeM/NucH family extracellular endonuclease [Pseudomonadota bacterium]
MKSSATSPLFTIVLAIALAAVTRGAAAEACHTPATPISEIQGHGERSPLAGTQVTVEGILTLDSRHRGGFRGFYLQQADDETDGQASTSEALFIHTGEDVGKPGHRVRVRGRVKEFHDLTELTDVRYVKDCGPARLPEPVPIRLPWRDGEWPPEHLENMRVRVNGRLTVIDSYHLARYGELTLAAQSQLIPTETLAPGPAAVALAQQQDRNRLVLDDNRGVRNPDPAPWPTPALAIDHTVRTGDAVSGLEGVLDYRFGAWRLQPSVSPAFHTDNARPSPPPRHPDATLRVLFLNLQNYFNGDGRGNGFPTARGAQTAEQFQRQTRRLVATMTAPDADVIAVAELENDGEGEHSALTSLARALGPHWRPVRAEATSGTDAIRTALLYRADRVEPAGPASRLVSGPYRQRGRPPLAQALRPLGRARGVQIIVPHLKSKACHGAKGRDRDQQDGQGCFSHRRAMATRALVDWAHDLPRTGNVAGTLITGDLNSYARETPLISFRDGGFTSLVHHFHPCTTDRCSHPTYHYKGRKGSLDYALASTDLAPLAVGAWSWAANAEEPPALGYRDTEKLARPPPWRSSDHNPVIVDLAL